MLVWSLLGCLLLLLPAEAEDNTCHVHRFDVNVKEDGKRNCIRQKGHYMTDEHTGVHEMTMRDGECGEGMCDVEAFCSESTPTFCRKGVCARVSNHCNHAKIWYFAGEMKAACADQGKEGDHHDDDDDHDH